MTNSYSALLIAACGVLLSTAVIAGTNAYIDTQLNNKIREKVNTELPQIMETLIRIEERQLMILNQMNK